jgi:uncharacterized DUF497 family protein
LLSLSAGATSIVRIREFEWDDGNVTHIRSSHGLEPEETEEVFIGVPVIRRTKKEHYTAFGPTLDGRYLVVVYEDKGHWIIRPITGWDMSESERRYYRKCTGG